MYNLDFFTVVIGVLAFSQNFKVTIYFKVSIGKVYSLEVVVNRHSINYRV